MTGAKPVIIDTSTSDNLMLSEHELKACMTPHTKAILLNNPCNPSGKVYSKRELEILRLIGEGCTNQEIAERLVITLHTVKKHSSNIYSKLGVRSRTQAVAKARDLQLL